MDLGPSTAVPVSSSKKIQVPVERHPHGAVPQQLSTGGSIPFIPLTWVPPLVRTATSERLLGQKDCRAVKRQAKPVKPLGRTFKRRTHRTRCSLARKARPTPNTQRAGTCVPQETDGRASNFPAPPIELTQPHAQAAEQWQNQALPDPSLLQGHDKGDMLSSEDQLASPQITQQAHRSAPMPISPGSPPGMWHQGHALDLPAMLNTPMAVRRLSHMLDISFQEQEYNMEVEAPIPTLPPLGVQRDADNSQLHGHQLTPCTLSGFILSSPQPLDQASLDKTPSSPQQLMCKAHVQSKAVLSQRTKLQVQLDDGVGCVTDQALQSQPAPTQMDPCTELDVYVAWDCITDGKDRRYGPTTNSRQMASALDVSVIAGLARAADQDAFHLTVLNSMMAHLLMLQTACEVSSIVLMLKYLFSCPMTQALLVETQIVYAVRPFKQHSHATVARLAKACMQKWVQLSRSG